MAVSKTAKGHKGESCTEAIRESIKKGEILSPQELFEKVKALGKWSEDTIWQHLIAHIVNLAPARYHYYGFEPFLFLHEDGRYELYNPDIHPKSPAVDIVNKPYRKNREIKPDKQLSLELKKRKRKSQVEEEVAEE